MLRCDRMAAKIVSISRVLWWRFVGFHLWIDSLTLVLKQEWKNREMDFKSLTVLQRGFAFWSFAQRRDQSRRLNACWSESGTEWLDTHRDISHVSIVVIRSVGHCLGPPIRKQDCVAPRHNLHRRLISNWSINVNLSAPWCLSSHLQQSLLHCTHHALRSYNCRAEGAQEGSLLVDHQVWGLKWKKIIIHSFIPPNSRQYSSTWKAFM